LLRDTDRRSTFARQSSRKLSAVSPVFWKGITDWY
jgi:hypothetical protein